MSDDKSDEIDQTSSQPPIDNDADIPSQTESSLEAVSDADPENAENPKDFEASEDVPDNIVTLRLDEALDHEYLLKLTDDILNHYNVHSNLHIDCSKIGAMSTAALQTFISINNYAKDHNKTVTWLTPSTEFIDGFNNIGLYSEMMQMEISNG